MTRFRASGELVVEGDVFAEAFRAARLDDEAALAVIRQVHDATGLLVDPHTAVGLGAGRLQRQPGTALVALATAHPAKFPDAVERATGTRPALPAHLGDLFDRPERTTVLPADLAAVESFVAAVPAR
jgi:threonine synthase